MGGKRGSTLVHSGSTDTFLDYTFANKANCSGGYLETAVVTESTAYTIQNETFISEFKLLKLKCYDLILG
jgi:hypothetical protein